MFILAPLISVTFSVILRGHRKQRIRVINGPRERFVMTVTPWMLSDAKMITHWPLGVLATFMLALSSFHLRPPVVAWP